MYKKSSESTGMNTAQPKNKKPVEAAALKYDPNRDMAPQITALGKGVIAEKIIETAKERRIPVYHDEKLAATLNQLRVGESIPKELYEVVAHVLVFIANIDSQQGEKYAHYR